MLLLLLQLLSSTRIEIWEQVAQVPPCILQWMFMHAAESGQKEAERLVCHSCRHGLPRLDPEADASAIQLVG